MATTIDTPLDPQRIQEFAMRLMGLYGGGMLTFMVDIGHRTGLFDAAAAGPATSAELAARAGVQERYAREWLGAMVTGGIFEYDAAARSYRLPAEHAACLSGATAFNMAPVSRLHANLAGQLDRVVDAFRHGGGVPAGAYRPAFTEVMDGLNRNALDAVLVDAVIPLAPGLVDRLRGGGRLAEVGCGTGHGIVLLARAFPRSSFTGYDVEPDAIERARAEAAGAGAGNARFEVRDAATIASGEERCDAVLCWDTVHDLADPAGVLRAIHDALVPGGSFVMVEPMLSSNLEDNVGNPMAPMTYATSTLYCMTQSLAAGGAGLGTAWGEQTARRLLGEAGFVDLQLHPAPAGNPINKVFVSRRGA